MAEAKEPKRWAVNPVLEGASPSSHPMNEEIEQLKLKIQKLESQIIELRQYVTDRFKKAGPALSAASGLIPRGGKRR